MLAAPVLNPITALSTLAAFKGQDPVLMTASRLLMAWLVTVAAGLLVSRTPARRVLLEKVLSASHAGHHHARGDVRARFGRALGAAMHDFLDTGKYFVFGVLITAVFNTQVIVRPDLQDGIAALANNDVLAVPAMMGLAFILSLCSTTDAFIAANMQGFSQASKLAFLIFGPMVDLKLLFMYASVFRRRFIVWLVCGLFVAAGLCSLVWKTFFMA
jgi:hypothetical protein